MSRFLLKSAFFLAFFSWVSFSAFAEEPAHEEATHEEHATEEKYNAGETIMEHITDNHEWHFFSLKKSDGSYSHVTLPLPVIVYSPVHGLEIFSSSHLEHGQIYNGYKLNEKNKIETVDETAAYDFSITKNVLQMLICVCLLLWLLIAAAQKYKTLTVQAPKGMQSFLEIVILFIRDEVARPMLGKKANKYLPYLLTIFFFIWIINLFGLVPGSANVTGNIAVTMTLAAFTFILMMVGSKRHYWKHLFVPSGIPVGVWPILIPIEFISNIIVKPFALMIRLFANMLAGHLIVLSFLSMIFIFSEKSIIAGTGVSIFSIAFSIFIYFLELLVTALQAYIFTILSALFIGETTAEPEHHH